MKSLLSFVGYYVGWFACVLGAANGWYWIGPLAVVVLVAPHVVWLTKNYRGHLSLLAVGAVFGWAVDTTLASAGIFSFGPHSILPWICPLWMVALWVLFTNTIATSMRWILGRYAVAAALGFFGGPVSYLYGAGIGAIEFTASIEPAVAVVAITWAIVTPTLVWLTYKLTSESPASSPQALKPSSR